MTAVRAAPSRLRGHWSALADVVLAAVLVTSAVVSLSRSTAAPQPWTTLVGVVWMAFIAFRSTAPLVACIGMGLCCLPYTALRGAPAEGGLWSFVAVLVISFTAGSRLIGSRRALGFGVLIVCGYVLQIVTSARPETRESFGDTFLSPMILFCGPFVAGILLQRARRQTAELRRLQAELESEREAHVATAAAQERTRIARELHDVISHSVSVMVVQAGAAELRLPPGSPAQEQLRAIRQTGKQALVELRRQLGVLRTADHAEPPAPIPTMADLSHLVGAGVTLEVDEAGTGDLPPGLAQTVFRIVQEALTNARRHAAGAPVRVRVGPGDGGLEVEVRNGPGRPMSEAPPGVGLGLHGMAERVDLYGGRLETGPTTDGGWRVAAILPLPAAERAS